MVAVAAVVRHAQHGAILVVTIDKSPVNALGAGKFITAGNASQLSDGASACVLMEAHEAARLGITPLGA